AHPHDTGGGSTVLPGVSSSGDTGYLDLNQGVYTIMSYVDGWATHPSGQLTYADTVDWGYQGTPMAVDIALLQDKYGANEDYHNGDDVYYLPDTNEPGTFFACIWDTGGTDEIRFDGTGAVVIDLRDATLGIEEGGGGWISYADGIYGGYTIANGVMIENATGGSGNDALIGNEGDNVLTGNGGADTFIFTVDGGGYDTVTDFEDGVDLLDFSDYDRIRIWQFDVFSDDTGTTIIYEDQTVFLADIDPADLGRADFVL
ncbi:M10 family metallopeptidase C-terminal domain-containing protein, partial [Actibacterium sp.]|uniref:M10 family metallopeptidase C-terminal domain-containing protein n=1 Tax=Actibacterium sp. TaxID=1872125 RepID=UPI003563B0E6